MKEIFDNIVTNLTNYVIKHNLESMVLGLSGGIDSTLCAVICHEVVERMQDDRKIKFIGVSLPSHTNANDETEIACAIGENLCTEFRLHSIEDEFNFINDSYINNGNADALRMNPLQKGNVKARLRMIYLYNMASMFKGIVIDTDNLTEHNLGFWTIHGDVGDVNPIGGLWKTEVYELAEWCCYNLDLNADTVKAIQRSIDILPTDGNGVKPGGDLAQIAPGMTYQQVDEVLQNEVLEINPGAHRVQYEELCDKYTKELVDGIISRHHGSDYKRVRLPIVLSADKIDD